MDEPEQEEWRLVYALEGHLYRVIIPLEAGLSQEEVEKQAREAIKKNPILQEGRLISIVKIIPIQ